MNNIKVENWLGNEIRFVEVDNEWWAVAKDVTDALDYRNSTDAIKDNVKDKYKQTIRYKASSSQLKAKMWKGKDYSNKIIISELGMYSLIMRSNKPEAEDFQDWVFDIIKSLRESVGLEQYEIFRMMDKQIQKEASRFIHENMDKTDKVSHVKLNSITNKAVSNKYGLSTSVKKEDMTPDMLVSRQPILNDTAELMVANEKYGLGLSVSKTIYSKYCE